MYALGGQGTGIKSEGCQVQWSRDDTVGRDRIEPKPLLYQTGMAVCQLDQPVGQPMRVGRQHDTAPGKHLGLSRMNPHRAIAVLLDGVQTAHMIEMDMGDQDRADLSGRNAVSP